MKYKVISLNGENEYFDGFTFELEGTTDKRISKTDIVYNAERFGIEEKEKMDEVKNKLNKLGYEVEELEIECLIQRCESPKKLLKTLKRSLEKIFNGVTVEEEKTLKRQIGQIEEVIMLSMKD